MEDKKHSMQTMRTQKLIVDSFFKLIASKNLNAISVIDICDEAMISRGTFYSYFEDKNQLLNFCVQEIMLGLDKQVMRVLPDKEYHAYYAELLEVVMDYLTDNKARLKSLFESSDSNTFFNLIQKYVATNMKHRMRDLKAQGWKLKVDEDMLCEFYCGGCMSAMRWWVVADKPIDREDFVAYIKSMAVDSIDRLIEK